MLPDGNTERKVSTSTKRITKDTMSTTYKITGNDAVRLAQRDGLTLRCRANPVAPEDREVTVSEAKDILREDPSLIYVSVTPNGWCCGSQPWPDTAADGYAVSDYFTSSGIYLGPDDDGVEPCWNDASL